MAIIYLEWLTDCSLNSSIVDISQWKGQGSNRCSVQSIRLNGLHSPNLGLESQGSPGTLWLQIFSLLWNSKEVSSSTAKDCLGNRIGELSNGSGGKQAKRKRFLPPCPFMWVGCHDKVWSKMVGLGISNDLSKKILHRHTWLLGFS